MIEWRWGLAPLSVRDETATNLAEVLHFPAPDSSAKQRAVPIGISDGPSLARVEILRECATGGLHRRQWTMPSRIRQSFMLLVIAIALAPRVAAVQTPAATATVEKAPLDQVIPVDPKITVGILPNGLRYYVRRNGEPQGRAELRLAVKAGSILEDEDQRGFAHFVEHLSFNGTRHFPKQDVIAFMQAIGMRFGAHVNAHTGFDETVYELQIPSTNPVVIDRSLLILEDWAQAVSFDREEIDRERGVILEEWRLGLGANARMQEKQMPVLLAGSRYAARSPIGLPETIRNVNHDRLKQFYADWYRPDLMAVIAVGDFDPAAVEASIKAHFGPIPASPKPRSRPNNTVPAHPGTLYAIASDKEATATTVGVIRKMPARDQRTIGAYRQQMVERLFAGMLSERLDEIAHKPNAPFLAAQTSRGIFVQSTEATTVQALVTDNGVEGALTALFAETERVARFGFTQTELDRQKVSSWRYLDQALIEKDKSPSGPLADEFIRNFMQDEPIPGIVYEQGLARRFLPQITLAEVNALASTWIPDGNRVVAVTAPEREGLKAPTEATLSAAIAAATGRPLTAYVDTVSKAPLLDPLPTPGAIAKTSARDGIGITEWQLSNGVRVVLMPTTFKEDEIIFRAVSPGGTSLARDQDFIAARTAEDVISEGGLGALSRVDLNKALASVNTFVSADIGDTEEGLHGGSTRKDLETMFQLIYLTFTAPRADPAAFDVLTGRLKRMLADQQVLPEVAFNHALSAALTQDHPRARPLTPALVDRMNLDASLAFYKDRFADASDFTFVFVGSFDVPTMKPLVERYLGSLPALYRREKARDVGIRPPTTVVEKQVVKGVDPKSQVSIVFTGPFVNNEMSRLRVRTMAEMLSGNLHQTLRENLGGTYGVSVRSNFTFPPEEAEYRVAISFGCDPARLDELVKQTWQVIEEFRNSGPSAGQMSNARTARLRDLETNLRENPYLLNRITEKYEHGEDVGDVFAQHALFDQLTAPAVRDAARQYLDPRRYVQVTLRPEAK
jgi:zinc protease